jgi:hypothetical protein
VRQGQAQAAFAGLEVFNPDGGGLGASECAGEARQQQRAVAQPGEVGFDRRQDLAQDVGGGGEFLAGHLAGIGGGAVHAGHGFADLRFGGGHRAAGDDMQVADRGAAQFDGVDATALAALGGEEGDHIGGVSGQAG